MPAFTPWLGLCHIRTDDSPSRPTLAAVLADSFESFEREMHVYISARGQQMIWAENVLPADEWLAKYPDHKNAHRLAANVSEKNPVELDTLGAGATGNAASENSSEYLTITEHKIADLPDQSSLPFWERDWIAPELKELLFGQPDNNEEPLRTYFIVDAAIRKNITGVFDLDVLNVPVRCLFKGNVAEELKETAPYLIDMTLPDGAWDDTNSVPAFHKNFFDKHWGQNTGIFIRTSASMAEVWGHFRKFTLVPREGYSKRVFVTFWSAQYVQLYFPHIASNKDRVATWFLRDGFVVHSMMAEQEGGAKIKEITLRHTLFTQHNTPSQPFVVTEYDLEPFYKDRNAKDMTKLIDALINGFPKELKNYSPEAISQIIADPIARMRKYGFSQKGSLYLLAAWSIFFGKTFETRDSSGRLLEICQSNMSEGDKMIALKDRMARLSVPKENVA